MTTQMDKSAGEFIADGVVEDDLRVVTGELKTRVGKLEEAVETTARLTHNRFHRETGDDWTCCTMVTCQLARRHLDRRTFRQ